MRKISATARTRIFFKAAGCIIFAGVILTTSLAAAEEQHASSLSSFHRRALRGERLNVVFLGGSLTWGANASDPQRTSWRGLMMSYLLEKYPGASFVFTDAAIGGTGSSLALFRIDRDVLPRKPDLIFLDFTVNDNANGKDSQSLASYERVLRDLLTSGSAVFPVLLCFRDHVSNPDSPVPARHKAHLDLAAAYRLPAANVLATLRGAVRAGSADPKVLWAFAKDSSHPDDPGYAAMFEAIRAAYETAISSKTAPQIPGVPFFPDLYTHRQRQLLVSQPLPKGWSREKTRRTSLWFDGLSSRWMDDVAAARKSDGAPPAPLEISFRGSMVALFGERDSLSAPFRVWVDGKSLPSKSGELWRSDTRNMNASGNGQLFSWVVLTRDLPDGPHTLKIEPDFSGATDGAELRIESVCSAGRE